MFTLSREVSRKWVLVRRGQFLLLGHGLGQEPYLFHKLNSFLLPLFYLCFDLVFVSSQSVLPFLKKASLLFLYFVLFLCHFLLPPSIQLLFFPSLPLTNWFTVEIPWSSILGSLFYPVALPLCLSQLHSQRNLLQFLTLPEFISEPILGEEQPVCPRFLLVLPPPWQLIAFKAHHFYQETSGTMTRVPVDFKRTFIPLLWRINFMEWFKEAVILGPGFLLVIKWSASLL